MVGDDEDGLRDSAVTGQGGWPEPLGIGIVSQRSPQCHNVAKSACECAKRLRRGHVLDAYVLFFEAKGFEPCGHHIVGGSAFRTEYLFSLNRGLIAVDVRIGRVCSLDAEERAVSADIEGVGGGFVIGDGNDVEALAQCCGKRGDSPTTGNGPIVGKHALHNGLARVKAEHGEIQPGFLVPSFLLGIPDGEGFVFTQPCRLHGDG